MVQMLNSNIPIFFSFIAIIISILGYLVNRKNINIVMRKEHEREDIKNAIKELKSTSDLLKKLPDYIQFVNLYFVISDISREIYEKDNLKFKIEFSNLVASIPEYGKNKQKNEYKRIQYNKNSINVSSLREVMKKLIYSWHKYKHLGSVYLNFNVEPDVVSDNFIDLTDFLIGLSEMEDNINKLKKFEFLESLEPEIFKTITENCDEILNILASILQRKEYIIEFNQNIKPSEIEDKMNDVLNFNRISEKTNYLSTKVVSRVDGLRKELTKQVLI